MKRYLAILTLAVLVFLASCLSAAARNATQDDLMKIEDLIMELRIELEDLSYRIDEAPTVTSDMISKLLEVEKEHSKLWSQAQRLGIRGLGYGSLSKTFPTGDSAVTEASEQVLLNVVFNTSTTSRIESNVRLSHEWAGSRTIALDEVRLVTSYRGAVIKVGNIGTFFSPLTLYVSPRGSVGELDYLRSERKLISDLARRDGEVRFFDGIQVNMVQGEYSGQTVFARLPYNAILFGTQVVGNSFGEKGALGLNYLRAANFPKNSVNVDGSTQPPRGNSVFSAVGVWRPAKWFEVAGEYAVSSFDDNLLEDTAAARLPGVVGKAKHVELGIKMQSGAFRLGYREVDPKFVSYGAQQLWDLAEQPRFVLGYDKYGRGGTTLSGLSKEQAELDAAPFGIATANRAGVVAGADLNLGKLGFLYFEYQNLAQLVATDTSGNPLDSQTLFNYRNYGLGYLFQVGRSQFQVGYQKRLCRRDDDESTPLDEKYNRESLDRGIQWNYQVNPQLKTTVALRFMDSTAQSAESPQRKEALLGLQYLLDNNTSISLLYSAKGTSSRADDQLLNTGWEQAELISRIEARF